jgi:hypothetical protein
MEVDAVTGGGIAAVALAAMGYMYRLAMVAKKNAGMVRSGTIAPNSVPVKVDRLREISGQIHEVDDKVDRLLDLKKENIDKMNKTAQQVRDLHVWHNAEDEDGVKKWYNKPSMERAIAESAATSKRNSEENARQTEVLKDILKELRKNKGSQ